MLFKWLTQPELRATAQSAIRYNSDSVPLSRSVQYLHMVVRTKGNQMRMPLQQAITPGEAVLSAEEQAGPYHCVT